jgi:fatty aldehyde-generating acyl-ACP reductase
MNAVPAPCFAALGHQETWEQISSIVRGLRPEGLDELTTDELRQIVPWIPPRTVSRISIRAGAHRPRVHGVYVDTFITPDEIGARPTRAIMEKVRHGIAAAEREGVRLITLGGFTSILVEAMAIRADGPIALTTGNTLTAALIVRGIERAARLLRRPLDQETLLVIGATGDVGSACARSLNGRTGKLLLAARNKERLEREAERLEKNGPVEFSTDVQHLLAEATIVIAAASTSGRGFELDACMPDAIVCDAGYPKNMASRGGGGGRQRLFWGGMGILDGGMPSRDGVLEKFYRFPVADAFHGCILEGAVLALAERYEPFSIGRGRITPAQVEEMWKLALAGGVTLAPLFNGEGMWPEETCK